jgi:hypothetical protein
VVCRIAHPAASTTHPITIAAIKRIKGDAGMEDIYLWSNTTIGEEFRGAQGGGEGVHILTGPIFIDGAEPGDLLKVEILDLKPRVNPEGKTFGSNAAAWWGFQARVPKVDASDFTAGTFTNTPGSNDEMVTIYELVEEDGKAYAVPSYQFEWPVITDPDGTRRDFIAYPGTCVPHDVHGGTTVSQHQVNIVGIVLESFLSYLTMSVI